MTTISGQAYSAMALTCEGLCDDYFQVFSCYIQVTTKSTADVLLPFARNFSSS